MKLKQFFALIFGLMFILLQDSMAFSDIEGHWAKEAITKYNEYGIVSGYKNKFNPDSHIIRGDLSIILNKIMDYQVKAENKFNDLEEQYYTDAVLKLNAAKIISGYGDASVKPTANVTRQEAAVMICKAFKIEANLDNLVQFNDADKIAFWAKEYVDVLASRGYVSGFKGNFNPENNITRAEIVAILNNIIGDIYSKEGTYTKNTDGTVVVNAHNVTLKDMTIENDLILADGIAEGNVTLNNIKVKGKTVIRGGGVNSIYITGNCDLSKVIVEKIDGAIRIKIEEGTNLNNLVIEEDSQNVIICGNVENVTVASNDITVNFEDATVTNVLVQSENNNIVVNEGAKINLVKVEGESASITGEGKVVNAEVKNNTIKIETKDTNVVVAGNGETITEEKDSGGGSGGGGGYNDNGSNGTTVTTYNISYNLLDGYFDETSKVPVTYTKNSKTIMLPIPVKEGYIFDGWYLDSNYETGKVIRIANGSTGNKTFYAKWSPISTLKNYSSFSYGALECRVQKNEVIVVDCDEKATEIVIPQTIYDYPVPSFNYNTFENCNELQKIELPNGITSIWYRSFQNCVNLEEIIIPDTVTTIGKDAFSGTKWLENKRQENSLVVVNNMLVDATTSTGDVVIPENVNNILEEAFLEAELTSVVIPDGVTTINPSTFKNCRNLEEIVVPESVVFIGTDAFYGTKWLEKQREINSLVIVNDILVDGKSAQGEIVIPDGVREIAPRAFYENKNITKVIFEDTVKVIGMEVFENCSNLSDVTLTKNIEEIRNWAFYGCNSLKTIELPMSKLNANTVVILPIMQNQIILGEESRVIKNYVNIYGNIFISKGTEYEIISDENEFDYIIINDEATLFNYYGEATEVSVPEEINGIPVTKIRASSFDYSDNLSIIAISSENVEIVGKLDNNQRILFGNAGSLVEVYAKENGIEFYPIGTEVLTIKDEANFEYRIVDGEATVIDYSGEATELIIPSKVEGYPVTKINKIYRNSEVEKLIIPDNIKEISANAFSLWYDLDIVIIEAKNVKLGRNFVNSDIILQGEKGSATEEYAKDDDMEFYPIGTEVLTIEDDLGFEYRVINGKAMIVGYNGDASVLTIPSKVEGYVVNEIKSYAFLFFRPLKQVIVPDTIEKIGVNAFWTNNLRVLTILAKDVELGEGLVYSNVILIGLEGSNVEKYAEKNNIEFYPVGTEIKIIEDKLGIEYIVINDEARVSDYNGEAKELTLPSEVEGYPVTKIKRNAFSSNDQLLTLTIVQEDIELEDNFVDKKVVLIGQNASTLEEYAKENERDFYPIGTEINILKDDLEINYLIVNGKARVINYEGEAKELTIPSKVEGYPVTRISEYAFYNSDTLVSITLPETIEEIDSYAFWTDIAKLVIPIKDVKLGESFVNYNVILIGLEGSTVEKFAKSNGRKFYPIGTDVLTLEDELGFEYIVVNGEATVSKYRGEVTELTIPSEVEGYSVTKIGFEAFYGWDIKKVIIPETVTEIEEFAFYTCDELEEVIIPESIEKIGNSAFWSCEELNILTIPVQDVELGNNLAGSKATSVILIGLEGSSVEKYAEENYVEFYPIGTDVSIVKDLSGIEYAIINNEAFVIGYTGEYDQITILSEIKGCKVKRIGKNAFRECDIKKVIIPETVTEIGERSFYDCYELKEVTIPESIEKIGGWSFSNCDNLITVTILASNVELENRFIDDNVILLGEIGSTLEKYAKENSIEFYPIGTEVLTIEDDLGLEYRVINGKATITRYNGDASVLTIPSEVEEYPVIKIGYEAFGGTDITKVIIPETVTEIGERSFYDCYELKEVTIPESIEKIGEEAFSSCNKLNILEIPAKDVELGDVFVRENTILIGLEGSSVEEYAEEYDIEFYSIGIEILLLEDDLGFEYVVVNGEATVSGYIGEAIEITIPNKVEEYPVTKIGFEAFYGLDITKVIIPETVTEIGERAFGYCSELKDVTIPESIEKIAYYAFRNCNNLKTLTMPVKDVELENNFVDNNVILLGKTGSTVEEYAEEYDMEFYPIGTEVEIMIDEAGVEYAIINDKAFVIGYNGEENEIIIPSEIEGYAVIKIVSRSLRKRNLLTITVEGKNLELGDLFTYNDVILLGLEDSKLEKYAKENGIEFYPVGTKVSIIEDAEYEYIVANGEATIKYYTGDAKEVIIPSDVDGYSVTKIGTNAFESYDITKVIIPETVTEIGERAFYDCYELKDVTIPESIEKIGERAFLFCNDLRTLTILEKDVELGFGFVDDNIILIGLEGSTTEVYAEENNIEFYALGTEVEIIEDELGLEYVVVNGNATVSGYTGEATELTIPSKVEGCPVTKIGVLAFAECKIKKVIISESIKEIGRYAFSNCYELTEITIPESVEKIGEEVFLDCDKLMSLTILAKEAELGNDFVHNKVILIGLEGSTLEKYAKDNGVEFYILGTAVSKLEDDAEIEYLAVDGKATVIGYNGNETELTILSEINGNIVTKIDNSVFKGNNIITKVIIPETVVEIGSSAFSNCEKLAEIIVPESVEKIGVGAFYNCKSLLTLTLPMKNMKYATGIKASPYTDNEIVILGITNSDVEKFANYHFLTFYPIGTEVEIIEDEAGIEYIIADEEATVRTYNGNASEVIIPSEIDGNIVTRIGSSAFEGAEKIAKVTLPESIKEIGGRAFNNCIKLTEINIPENVEIIGYSTFEDCTNLQQLVVPAKEVKLRNILVEDNVILFGLEGSTIEEYAKNRGNMFYPIGTEITMTEDELGFKYVIVNGEAVVSKYTGEESEITIPSEVDGIPVTRIGASAFRLSEDITKVTIPGTIKQIESHAFYNSHSLTEVTIEKGIQEIDEYAFCVCYNLTNITIPESIEKIGARAFRACSKLKTLTILSKDVELADDLVDYSIILMGLEDSTVEVYAKENDIEFYPIGTEVIILEDDLGFKYVVSNGEAILRGYDGDETELTIPSEVEGYDVIKIGVNAFEGYDITKVIIPETVREIEKRAFYCCSNLSTIVMSESIEVIGDEAFCGCDALVEVTISESVQKIGTRAYADCYKLKTLTILAKEVELGNYFVDSDVTLMGLEGSAVEEYAKNNGNTFYSVGTDVLIVEDDVGIQYLTVNGEATVIGYNGNATELTIPSNINGNLVIKIDENAFRDNDKITSIIISEGVKEIGMSAFSGCLNLANVTIPESIEEIETHAFEACESLKVLSIPSEEVEMLSGYFISNNVILLGLEDSIVEEYAQYHDIRFYPIGTEVNIVKDELGIEYAITDIETTINGYTGEISELTIPSEINGNIITKIGGSAFRGNAKITKVIIPEGIKEIDSYAFCSCANLLTVTIAESIESIGSYSFDDCSNLLALTIKANDFELKWPFVEDSNAVLIGVEGSPLEEYAEYYSMEFYPEDTEYEFITDDIGLEYFAIDSKATVIGYSGNESDIEIPRVIEGCTVTKVGYKAFYYNDVIKNVILAKKITEIDRYAFYSSTLEKILIPDSVTKIWSNPFRGCKNLIIYGYSEAYAKTFAEENEIEFIEIIPTTVKKYIINDIRVELKGPDNENLIQVPDGTRVEKIELVDDVYNVTLRAKEGYIFDTMEDVIVLEDVESTHSIEKDGVIYELVANKYFIATDIVDKTVTEIVILDNIDGYPVKAIDMQIENDIKITIPFVVDDIEIDADECTIIIAGEKNSEAEDYANENEYQFINIYEGQNIIPYYLEDNIVNGEKICINVLNDELYSVPENIKVESITKNADDTFTVVLSATNDYLFKGELSSVTFNSVEKGGTFEHEGFKYLLRNNELIIIEYLGLETEIVIPEIVLGYDVVEIDCIFPDTLTKITILDNIEEINKDALDNCSDELLVYVVAGSEAEYFVKKKTDYDYYYAETNKILFNISKNSVAGKIIYVNSLNSELLEVPENTEVEGITENDNGTYTVVLNAINGYVFNGNLSSITFKTVKEKEVIEEDDFWYLVSKEELVLIKYVGSKTEIQIPETVEDYDVVEIDCVFPSTLTKITILDNIEEINEDAFSECVDNVVIYVIPDSDAEDFVQSNGLTYDYAKIIFFNMANNTVNKEVLYVDIFTNELANVLENIEVSSITENSDGTFTIVLNAINDYLFKGDLSSVTFTNVKKGGTIEEGDFKYSLFNNELILTEYLGSETEIEIPENVQGYNVVEIDCIFPNTLTKITVLENIEEINEDAFDECDDIKIVGIRGSYAEEYAEEIVGIDFVEFEEEPEEPITSTQKIYLNLANKGVEGKEFTLKLKLGEQVIYEEKHTREDGEISIDVTGSGEMTLEVYVDGDLNSTQVITFN